MFPRQLIQFTAHLSRCCFTLPAVYLLSDVMPWLHSLISPFLLPEISASVNAYIQFFLSHLSCGPVLYSVLTCVASALFSFTPVDFCFVARVLRACFFCLPFGFNNFGFRIWTFALVFNEALKMLFYKYQKISENNPNPSTQWK